MWRPRIQFSRIGGQLYLISAMRWQLEYNGEILPFKLFCIPMYPTAGKLDPNLFGGIEFEETCIQCLRYPIFPK